MAMSKNYKRIGLKSIQYLLGIIFLLSGVGKLIDGSNARYLVELMATEFYWLIEFTNSIVLIFSILELLIAGALLWGKKLTWSFASASVMLIFFSSVLSYFYLQGMSVESCGCFGAIGIGGGLGATLIRNGVLLVMSIAGLVLLYMNQKSPEN